MCLQILTWLTSSDTNKKILFLLDFLYSVEQCNFTPNFSNSKFHFPSRFEKWWFHYKYTCCKKCSATCSAKKFRAKVWLQYNLQVLTQMNSERSPLLAACMECTIFDMKIPSADSLRSKAIEKSNSGPRLDTYCKKKWNSKLKLANEQVGWQAGRLLLHPPWRVKRAKKNRRSWRLHLHLQSAFFNDCFFLEGFEITWNEKKNRMYTTWIYFQILLNWVFGGKIAGGTDSRRSKGKYTKVHDCTDPTFILFELKVPTWSPFGYNNWIKEWKQGSVFR